MGSQRTNRWLVILLHAAATVTFVVLPLMFFGPRNDERRTRPPRLEQNELPRLQRDGHQEPPTGFGQLRQQDFRVMQWHSVLFNIALVSFFYVNMYWLVPRILTQMNWLYYAGAIAVSFLAVLALNSLIDYALVGDDYRPGRPEYFVIINFLLVFGLSTALRLTSDRIKFEREREQRENENLKSELSLLRSQISPHFMFNVLNSLASLARKKSDQLEPVIIQLSQLMRYMLYDAGEKKMTINKEIGYLTNYIDLQKLRFGNDITIIFNRRVARGDLPVEPMLLIPFVENAFKHGTGLVADPSIEIDLVSDDTTLSFTVLNKFSHADQAKDSSSGIGVQNVRRRLDLLYKDMHSLNLTQSGEWFKVELKLILK